MEHSQMRGRQDSGHASLNENLVSEAAVELDGTLIVAGNVQVNLGAACGSGGFRSGVHEQATETKPACFGSHRDVLHIPRMSGQHREEERHRLVCDADSGHQFGRDVRLGRPETPVNVVVPLSGVTQQ
jgi:hypothetical protein